MDGWMDGWMDGRTDGRTDGWRDGWLDLGFRSQYTLLNGALTVRGCYFKLVGFRAKALRQLFGPDFTEQAAQGLRRASVVVIRLGVGVGC